MILHILLGNTHTQKNGNIPKRADRKHDVNGAVFLRG